MPYLRVHFLGTLQSVLLRYMLLMSNRFNCIKQNAFLKFLENVFSDKSQNLERFLKLILPGTANIVLNNIIINFFLDLEIPEICCKIELMKFISPPGEFQNNIFLSFKSNGGTFYLIGLKKCPKYCFIICVIR